MSKALTIGLTVISIGLGVTALSYWNATESLKSSINTCLEKTDRDARDSCVKDLQSNVSKPGAAKTQE